MTDYVEQRKPQAGGADHRMFDGVQHKRRRAQRGVRRPLHLCPHMKRITLQNIRDCLVNLQFEVTVPEEMIERGRLAVQRMIDLPPPAVPARYDIVKARHHVDVELI
nr:quinolinate synthase NadA [uncultured Brevundimonas sp.]